MITKEKIYHEIEFVTDSFSEACEQMNSCYAKPKGDLMFASISRQYGFADNKYEPTGKYEVKLRWNEKYEL